MIPRKGLTVKEVKEIFSIFCFIMILGLIPALKLGIFQKLEFSDTCLSEWLAFDAGLVFWDSEVGLSVLVKEKG